MLQFFIEGLNKLDQAEEYLLQARWTVLKTVECPNTIKHKLCRHLGLLYAAKGQYDMALRELADDVSFVQYVPSVLSNCIVVSECPTVTAAAETGVNLSMIMLFRLT